MKVNSVGLFTRDVCAGRSVKRFGSKHRRNFTRTKNNGHLTPRSGSGFDANAMCGLEKRLNESVIVTLCIMMA